MEKKNMILLANEFVTNLGDEKEDKFFLPGGSRFHVALKLFWKIMEMDPF